jgi:hypothetical protein
MSDTKIVAATKVSAGKKGLEYPSRYVVLRWSKGTNAHEYSRHMQVMDGIHDDYFIYGHYKSHYEDALEDMLKSMRENNESFPYGNISYIPGFDFAMNNTFSGILVDRVKLFMTTRFNRCVKAIMGIPKTVRTVFQRYMSVVIE